MCAHQSPVIYVCVCVCVLIIGTPDVIEIIVTIVYSKTQPKTGFTSTTCAVRIYELENEWAR